jgi:hypothetical protein
MGTPIGAELTVYFNHKNYYKKTSEEYFPRGFY